MRDAGIDPLKVVLEGDRLRLSGAMSKDATLLKEVGGKPLVPNFWTFPASMSTVHSLRRRYGDRLEVDDSVDKLIEVHVPEDVDERLFDYQKTGVAYLLGGNRLLSFSPGLGKTATAIVAADQLNASKILVVAPLTLLPTWQAEIAQWSSRDIPVTNYPQVREIRAGWNLVNYDLVARKPLPFECHWDLIILDESVLVKNRQTKRYRSIKQIRQKADHVWALSGSPVTRDFSDLWSQFNLLRPKAFSSFWRFAGEYCTIENTPWGVSIVGSRPGIDARQEFLDILLSISKEDVIELPEMTFETVDCDLTPSQRAAYNRALKEFLVLLESGERMLISNRMSQLIRLSQIVGNLGNLDPDMPNSSGKIEALGELTESRYYELPAIVWTRFSRTGEMTAKMLRSYGVKAEFVFGGTPVWDRDRIFQAYRQGEIDILVLSTSVGKFGLTFTNTKTIIYLESSFSFDDHIQSLNRVHRIGLRHSPHVIRMRCPGTVDELVADNLAGKALDLASISTTQLANLLRSLGK